MNLSFLGAFQFNRPLASEHREYLTRFARVRHVERDLEIASQVSDPIRERAGLPLGDYGAYFVGDCLTSGGVSPHTPSYHCPWQPDETGTLLEGFSGASEDDPVKWLEYLIHHFFNRWGYHITGKVSYRVEEQPPRLYVIWASRNRVALDVANKPHASTYEPTDEDYEKAQRLISEGYLQTSGKYRSLARLPSGVTGIEALEVIDPLAAKRVREHWESHATREFLTHALRPTELEVTLSPTEFKAFKRLGGTSC